MDHERMRRLHGGKSGGLERVGFDVALKSKAPVATDTWEFRFERPAGFVYKAGRHVRMTMLNPAYRDRGGETRFFSFASAPHDEDLVFVMRMRDTAFKRSLMALNTGEVVRIEMLVNAPHGAFALDENAIEPAVFLVGGIGVVPAYSMIRDTLERSTPRKLVLFYASRTPEDAPFLVELQDLAARNANLVFVPTMTGGDLPSWAGESGRSDANLIKRHIGNFMPATYYIAGLPDMVSAMRSVLKAEKVPAANVLAEEFGGFTMAHGHGKKRGSLLTIGIVLAVAAVVVAHLAAGAFVLRLGSFELSNPAMIAVGGVAAVLLLAKLVFFLRSGHRT
ncbi:FAD-dependent oxidoreductase [Asticcacaulis taihuensis]|uniref:Ferredoxin-NADP reductase n=1 Tax=Asticcacaulis taihuensis TaxID=260084 RepID=A0A1G4PTE9_9CAUL|nr:FAD-dependent oxidoreductase [Asticcacaulis taihuensis]SCW35378.1 Ferredoxin-NADP reductase [Asticcacaulis taihuensis]